MGNVPEWEGAAMKREDQVAVYAGQHMACIQLQLALGSNDIPADVETFAADEFGVDGRVYVKTEDVEKAAPIVQEFLE